jgi:hypothetical protein
MNFEKLFSSGLPSQEKPKRVRSKITAAALERKLDSFDREGDPWPIKSLWVSGLGKINIPTWIIDYWSPGHRKENWRSRLYGETGNVVHRIIQEHLFGSKVLTQLEEPRVFCQNFGFSGKVDGLLHGQEFGIDGIVHGEIKVCNSFYYKEWQHPDSLPVDYRMQATVYQKLLEKEETCFILVNRDDFSFRTLFYHGEESLWETAKSIARDCWGHIRNRTFPGSFDGDFEAWVAKQIEAQPERKFVVFPCE